MARRTLWTLGLIGAGYGVLFFFAVRHAVRDAYDWTALLGSLSMLSGLLQAVVLGIVFLGVMVVFVSLGRLLELHKM